MTDPSFILAAETAGSLASRFTWIDWAVVVGYLAFTTAVGAKMAGKQATIRDFFLGGRKLPWYAVCGSNIATEISAVTFVGVPAIVFASTGNFTYMQLGVFGSIIARVIVALVFVPAYYKREIYSPYDYMANELGGAARTVTTCLFVLGGALAQGARVYLTALILDLVIGKPVFGQLAAATGIDTMVWSIYTIGVIAIGWTLIGGITTVIWTDVILFGVFLVGAFVALGAVIGKLPGGMSEMFSVGWNAKEAGAWGKFTFFDFDISPAKEFTIYTALIAATWGNLGAFGTDQLMAQRIFCCKGAKEAKIAVIAGCAGLIIAVTMLFVGVGLYAFYQQFPLTGEAAELVAKNQNRIFAVFIIQELPPGLSGLVIAGIFAAAISSLLSVVASFSQTTIAAFYLPLRQRRLQAQGNAISSEEIMQDPKLVLFSRVLVLVWGVVLCIMAQVADAATGKFPQILNLALAMAGYTGGALLAGFLLAFLRLKIDARGFLWSAPLSVLMVVGLVWHEPWAHRLCWIGAVVILVTWFWHLACANHASIKRLAKSPGKPVLPIAWQTLILILGAALMLYANYFGYLGIKDNPNDGNLEYITVAWPWFTPIGSVVAFVWGYLLARVKDKDCPTDDP